jgi:carbonic anhydrase/acetyltransferase-like protein (isoleucine patch superfamily)
MLIRNNGIMPQVDPTAYVHSSAQLIGDVHVAAQSSVWFNAVIRGDVFHVRIGVRTNVQDNTTVHVTTNRWPAVIGDDVTVGHNVVLHGCRIGDRCLIGIGAIVLDGSEIGDECIVGAGALVTPGTKVEPGWLVLGSPAKPVRRLDAAEMQHLVRSARNYVVNAERYRAQGIL